MVNVPSKRCGKEGCSKLPSFGAAGGRKAEFCATHAPAGMVNVSSSRCGEEGCSKQPSFGAAGGRKAEFCATHAPAGMINVRGKRCGMEGCSKHPSFGTAGGRKAEFCATHAPAGMIAVRTMECGKEGCSKHPSSRAVGGRKAEFCAAHAPKDMVSEIRKRCGKEGRSKQAYFGVAGVRKTELCAVHAPAGMVNVSSSRCDKEGCSERPYFGATGSKKAKFYAIRSRAGIAHFTSKRCGKEDSKHPSIGAAGGRETKFCATPARAGLISMNDNERVPQRCSKRVRKHQYTCRDAAHCLAMASDVPHVQAKNRPNDSPVVGKSGVDIDERDGRPTHPSDAGPNANDGCCNTNFSRSSRVMCSRRRGADSTTTLPVASRQPPGTATADGVSPDGSQSRMKTKIETTVAPPRGFYGKRTSGELVTTQSSTCDSMSDGGSSGTTTNRSCYSSIASGRNTKWLRRTVRGKSVFDVAAGNDETFEGEGGDVKRELDVSAPSCYVSAASSRTRER
ncbi:unnamed protein product [Sphacelaria rigidula]